MSATASAFLIANTRGAEASSRHDWNTAALWWERAWRLSGKQTVPALQLATVLNRVGDARVIDLLQRHPGHERTFAVALPLAAALYRASRAKDAAEMLGSLLSGVAVDALAPLAPVAGAIAKESGAAGWLGWTQGRLIVGGARGQRIDPRKMAFRSGRNALRLDWRAESDEVWSAPLDLVTRPVAEITVAAALLGSPLRTSAIQKVDGVVERMGQRLQVRVWHPGNPGQAVLLLLTAPGWRRVVEVNEAAPPSADYPLTHCRQAEFEIPDGTDAVRVVSAVTGEPLLGSPLMAKPRTAEPRRPVSLSRGIALIAAGRPAQMATLLERVQEFTRLGAERIIVVQDGGTRPPTARSLPFSVEFFVARTGPGLAACWNEAARKAEANDLLVISAEARLWPGALPFLANAAGPDGVALPISREDQVISAVAGEATAAAALAAALPPFGAVLAGLLSIKALFVRRSCFDLVGGFSEGVFALGDAAMADLATRAARRGQPVRTAPAAFVWAPPVEEFGPVAGFACARDHRALMALAQDVPVQPVGPVIAAWCVIDTNRFLRGLGQQGTTLLITHDEGGGIERYVQERIAELHRAGKAVAILRSLRGNTGLTRLELANEGGEGLAFRLPEAAGKLLALLQQACVKEAEVHHLRQHAPAVALLPGALGIPYTVVLHDYAMICPRVTMIGQEGAYCGETRGRDCESCAGAFARDRGEKLVSVRDLQRRTGKLLAKAAHVLAPSRDTAQRFARYFPSVRIEVRPWEPSHRGRRRYVANGATTVCAVGAFNRAKGYDVLLACVREAASQTRPLRFVVVGHTIGDAALIEAGAFITGPYDEDERAALIARHDPAVGFFPSIWPETWSYALTGLLAAGLPTACFDIGAQADRVRAAWGSAIALGSSAASINQRLLELAE